MRLPAPKYPRTDKQYCRRPRLQNSATTAQATTAKTQNVKPQTSVEELPAFVPAPKSLVSDRSATELAAVNSGVGGAQNAVLTSLPRPIQTNLTAPENASRLARLSLTPQSQALKVGERRRFAIELTSDVQLSLAVLALRFDPKVVTVLGISAGPLFQAARPPILTQSIDPGGVCLISVSALNGAAHIKGSGVLIFIEVEAIAAGDAAFALDRQTMHLVASDAREVVLDVSQSRTTVK